MVLAGVVFIVMVCIALWANSRFKAHDLLPMQWSLTGKVNWSAPRPLALAFFPGLAVLTAIGILVVGSRYAPRPGQEREAAYAIPVVMILLLLIQCVHLFFAGRTLRST